ncbi:MAG: hypothetical protein AAF517_00080 [Planctomycetota bacterium]
MSLSRPRQIAISLLVGAPLLFGIAAYVKRDELLTLLRLRELREKPELLLEWLFAEDPIQVAARDRFLLERAGKEQLFEIYLSEYEKTQYKINVFRRLQKPDDKVSHGVLALGTTAFSQRYYDAGAKGHSESSMPLAADDPIRRERVFSFLDTCAGEFFRSDRFPGLEFCLTESNPDRLTLPRWPSPPAFAHSGKKIPWKARGIEYVCHFRFLR